MKTHLFVAALFTLCCGISTFAAEDYIRESGWAGETFTSKVIKDLSFRDEGAEYVAYLVRWREHDVVVTAPSSLEQRYAIGDSIRCQMTRQDVAHGKEMRSQLTFAISRASASPNIDLARLKAIAEEVAARRAQREKAAAEMPAKTKP